MEEFPQCVVDYMKKHPDHVLAATAAVMICPHLAVKPNLLSGQGMEEARAHIFIERCTFCRKIFLELLLSQEANSPEIKPSASPPPANTPEFFKLPADVLGYLEWSTGTLRINMTPQDLTVAKDFIAHRRVLDGTHPDDQRVASFLRAVTHEHFHFLQVITTGYAYSFACVVFQFIMEYIARLLAPQPSPPSLSSFLEQPLAPEPRVTQKFAEIDSPGPDGLTIRDVIESAAHLYECKTHIPNLDHRMYCAYLAANRVLSEYRRAYDLASAELGSAAFHNFLVAAAIALCFRWPHQVFPDVLHLMSELAHLDAVYREPKDLPGLLGIVPALRSMNHRFLGTADAMAKSNWEGKWPLNHPFYTQALNAALPIDDPSNLVLLIIDPRVLRPAFHALVTQPVLFNNNLVQLPAGFETRDVKLPSGERLETVGAEKFVSMWISLAVICHNLIDGTGHAMRYRLPPPLNLRASPLHVQP